MGAIATPRLIAQAQEDEQVATIVVTVYVTRIARKALNQRIQ